MYHEREIRMVKGEEEQKKGGEEEQKKGEEEEEQKKGEEAEAFLLLSSREGSKENSRN